MWELGVVSWDVLLACRSVFMAKRMPRIHVCVRVVSVCTVCMHVISWFTSIAAFVCTPSNLTTDVANNCNTPAGLCLSDF
ncbi:unnamed protein product [Ectocarpus sp. 6 AP-2014]